MRSIFIRLQDSWGSTKLEQLDIGERYKDWVKTTYDFVQYLSIINK